MKNYKKLVENIQPLSISELFYLMNLKFQRVLRRHLSSSYFLSNKNFINIFNSNTDESFIKLFNNSLRNKFFIDSHNKKKLITVFKREYRSSISSILIKGEEYCNHVFNLLGSGKVKLERDIDWHRDFKSGYHWKKAIQYIGKKEHIILQGPSDVKVPLELSRFQHFTTIGKTYWLSNNEKYAQEFIYQIESWIKENPLTFGVNWSCPMDAAIRGVNWIWGYAFFMDSPSLSNKFKIKFLKSLFLHGRFIYNNLEIAWARGNHFLTDIIGLTTLGLLFPKSRESDKWFKFGYNTLKKELKYQIHNDGVDFEASIAYHRLVTEMVLTTVLLLRRNSVDIPDHCMKKLEKMIEFVMYYTKLDGTCPIIGDADNGRLQILANNDINDHRYLLSIGAVLFKRGDFKNFYNKFNEEAFWLLGCNGLYEFKNLASQEQIVRSKAFHDGGYYIMRKEDEYMIIRCGDVGLKGHGGHGHCDCLSFELFVKDKTFIIDPGSYVYTADVEMRNLFRSTKYHNTVMIDGEEMNQFGKKNLSDVFSMKYDAVPKLNTWKVSDKKDIFDSEHTGYQRLRNPVLHRRKIEFDKSNKTWLVRDILSGTGKHLFEWYFHFTPMFLEQDKKNPLKIRTRCNGKNIQIVPKNDYQNLRCELIDGWISYSYGTKEKAPIVKYELKRNLDENDVDIEFEINLVK